MAGEHGSTVANSRCDWQLEQKQSTNAKESFFKPECSPSVTQTSSSMSVATPPKLFKQPPTGDPVFKCMDYGGHLITTTTLPMIISTWATLWKIIHWTKSEFPFKSPTQPSQTKCMSVLWWGSKGKRATTATNGIKTWPPFDLCSLRLPFSIRYCLFLLLSWKAFPLFWFCLF